MRLGFAALCFAARVTSEDPEAAAQAVEALLESTEEALPDSTTINAGDAVRTDAHGTEALSEAEIAVWSGLDAAVEEAAFALIPDDPLVDHDWLDVVRADNNMSALEQRCQRAIKRAAWQEARALPPFLYTDALDGVSVGDRDDPGDPRIVYFIGASRDTAAIMVSRLVLALYHTSHLFLIHVDLKAAPTVHEQLAELIKSHPNVHLMQTRRLVQWAGWTMVATMLDALKSINERNMDCKPRARHGPPLPARTRHAAAICTDHARGHVPRRGICSDRRRLLHQSERCRHLAAHRPRDRRLAEEVQGAQLRASQRPPRRWRVDRPCSQLHARSRRRRVRRVTRRSCVAPTPREVTPCACTLQLRLRRDERDQTN